MVEFIVICVVGYFGFMAINGFLKGNYLKFLYEVRDLACGHYGVPAGFFNAFVVGAFPQVKANALKGTEHLKLDRASKVDEVALTVNNLYADFEEKFHPVADATKQLVVQQIDEECLNDEPYDYVFNWSEHDIMYVVYLGEIVARKRYGLNLSSEYHIEFFLSHVFKDKSDFDAFSILQQNNFSVDERTMLLKRAAHDFDDNVHINEDSDNFGYLDESWDRQNNPQLYND